jgi:hypothetical protein
MASASSRFSFVFSSSATAAAWLRTHPSRRLGLPFVDAGVADAVLAAQIDHRNLGLLLLQDPDDLL